MSEGCKVVTTDFNLTVCSCDHMTTFVLLMKRGATKVSACQKRVDDTADHSIIYSYVISKIFLVASWAFLVWF